MTKTTFLTTVILSSILLTSGLAFTDAFAQPPGGQGPPGENNGQNGTTLTAYKTAVGEWERIFDWSITKSAEPTSHDMFVGDSADSTWTVSVTKDGFTDFYTVSGEICVTNGGEVETEGLKLVDQVQYKIPGPTKFQDIDGATQTIIPDTQLAPGETMCYPYDIEFTPVDGANQYRNTVQVTITNHSGQLGEPFGPNPKTSFSLPDTPVLVNDSVSVTDSNGMDFGTVSDSTTFPSYPETFDCADDEGTHTNIATITETGQEASADVVVNCYALTVTKTADTSFDRDWTWTIEKSSDTSELTLLPDATGSADYDVVLDATSEDSNYAVSGTITITNPAPIAATLTGVSDTLSDNTVANVDCGNVNIVPANNFIQCSYDASLSDASTLINTATATLQNIPVGTTDFEGSEDVVFGNSPTNESDECVSVDDDQFGSLDPELCADELPKTFEYTTTVAPSGDTWTCPVDTFVNVASFETNDSLTTGNDDHTITIICDDGSVPPGEIPEGDFRTQTQGGWGASASGNNPGVYRDANFDNAFPNGLVIGEANGFTATFTSSAAIEAFLPAGGTPDALTEDLVDPETTPAGVFAGQIVALTLSVGFDAYDANFGSSGTALSDLVVFDANSVCLGMTVQEILDDANLVVSGQSSISGLDASELNDCLAGINQNFVDGEENNGFLGIP